MRFISTSILASLAYFVSLTQAKGNSPNVKTVCTTAYCQQKGSRTQYVADETIVVQKPAPPCYVVQTAVVTPRAKTVTSIQPLVTTITVTDSQQTDIVTSTSTVLAFTYPTTTTTSTSTPITTTTVTVPNPSDSASTVTSYTLAAPSPTFTNNRRAVAEPLEPRGAQNIVKAGQKNLSPAFLGKHVYCHKEITTTSTFTKPCHTVTSYSWASRSTSTSISTFIVPETVTQIPDHATSVVTTTTTSTVTAPTITSTVTEYAMTSTVTATETAALSVTTTIVGEYALCDPSRIGAHDVAVDTGASDYIGAEAFDSGNVQECCHAAVSASNAILFFYDSSCLTYFAESSAACPVPVFLGPKVLSSKSAALQCAA